MTAMRCAAEVRSRELDSRSRLARTAVLITALICSAMLAAQRTEAAEVYRIDPVHSTIIFRISHLGVSYAYGRFRDVSGTLQLDAEHYERSAVRVEIDADSIDTGNEKRDRHLRSADFFEVERFPSITFSSTRVLKESDDTYAVTGDLSLHGVTRPVTVHLKATGSGPDPWQGFRVGFEGHATIKRSDFGLDRFDAGAPGALGNEVQLTISVEALRR